MVAGSSNAFAVTAGPVAQLVFDPIPSPQRIGVAFNITVRALDVSGNLKNLQVLEPGPASMTAKIIAALPSWKFRPAMRGQQPVEVNAILGFGIDTNDRN